MECDRLRKIKDVEAQFESDNNNISINNTANRGQVSPTVSDSCVKQGGTCTGYDINEVAAHNMYSSCWIVISDLVYDVTDFLEEHPGSDEIIMEYCGHDATMAFKDVGHSHDAQLLLESYCIGYLKRT